MIRYIFLMLFFLSSCSSLHPIYGRKSHANENIKNVEIEEIDSIDGSEIYYQLSRIIGSASNTKYSLRIKLLSDNSYPLAISEDSELVKQNVSQRYYYELRDKKDGKLLDSAKFRIVGSYNALDSSFNSYTNEKFTKKNIAHNVAEEVHMRLMLYFASK